MTHLYDFLEETYPKIAKLGHEIESILLKSPRMALTSCRTLVETLLDKAVEAEELTQLAQSNFQERISHFHHEGLFASDINSAFYTVRKSGNAAAHDSFRKFYMREALESWENTYKIVRWYIEVYGSVEIEVPEYDEPVIVESNKEDLATVLKIIKELEGKLKDKEPQTISVTTSHVVATSKSHHISRIIRYNEEQLEIPFFLRDAFLLPQRFPRSTTFLVRLNGEQEARIMSELPDTLEGIHQYVKRFSEKNSAIFFEELTQYVEEEIIRKETEEQHPGEMMLYHKADYIIVTEVLGDIELTNENFPGSPSFIKQLHEQGIITVGQLPKELVVLGKYKNVGETTLSKLFGQLKSKAMEVSKDYVTV